MDTAETRLAAFAKKIGQPVEALKAYAVESQTTRHELAIAQHNGEPVDELFRIVRDGSRRAKTAQLVVAEYLATDPA